MSELSIEDMSKAEQMSLEELKELAAKEPDQEPEPEPVDTGTEELDNSEESAEQVYRKVIENGDGTTDVYEASSLEELVDKIAEGKRQAVEQMRRVQAEKKELAAKSKQESDDLNYVNSEEFKADPIKATQEMVRRELERLEAARQRSIEVQSRFVNTHPDYVADPNNGNGYRLVTEFRRLYPNEPEFTAEGLEKAYLNLKHDGLLVLRSEEADAAAETEAEETARTEQPKVEATQQRSPKRSSTISTRTSRSTVVPKPGFDEDEAYKLPLEEVLARAEKQFAETRQAQES